MRFLRTFATLLLASAALLHAEPPAKLRAGIYVRPPFAMKDADGKWNGLAVDVWERVSSELNLPYEYVETSMDDAIVQLATGKLDFVVGGIGVSPERAKMVEFSQPFLAMPAAVAVLKRSQIPYWTDFIRDVLAHGVGFMLVILVVAMLFFSVMLWLVERRVDRTHFGGRPWHGFGSALWFSAVTMTTVGYGDKTPQSLPGRVVVFFWMFLGVVIISVFTGAVASSITASRMDARIIHTRDLAKYRTGALDGSLSRNILANVGIPSKVYPNIEEGLRALEAGTITAFVDGEVNLRYAANRDYPGEIIVTPLPTTHFTYAFAARPGLPLAELKAINIALIEQVMQPGWEQEVERWLGPPATQ
jgi:ABC-type amino acid transport substrate-binding protein